MTPSLPERKFDVKNTRSLGFDPVPSIPMPTRYRCTACGNLTRFDVVAIRRTRSFHHFSVGGELTVEDEEVLSEQVEEVSCRWCGSPDGVVSLDATGAEA
jgi:hypothetical protein